MGARGKVKELGARILVRFAPDTEVEIRVLAAAWSMSISDVVRILATEGLSHMKTDKERNTGP